MKRFLAALSFGLLAATANATVVDFDDIGGFTDRANFPALGIENSYQGFTWPTESGALYWAVVNNTDSQFSTVGAYSGTQAGWNWSDGGVRNIIFQNPTDVTGAYFNVFMAQQDWGAATVQFAGYDAADQLIGTSSVLNLDRDSANPAWQWLTAGLSGVTRLSILSTNDRFGGQGWWTIDDLTLNESTGQTPAPATIVLIGLGLAGIGFKHRKRIKVA